MFSDNSQTPKGVGVPLGAPHITQDENHLKTKSYTIGRVVQGAYGMKDQADTTLGFIIIIHVLIVIMLINGNGAN